MGDRHRGRRALYVRTAGKEGCQDRAIFRRDGVTDALLKQIASIGPFDADGDIVQHESHEHGRDGLRIDAAVAGRACVGGWSPGRHRRRSEAAVDDRLPRPLPRRLGKRVVSIRGETEIEHSQNEQHEDIQDDRHLDHHRTGFALAERRSSSKGSSWIFDHG